MAILQLLLLLLHLDLGALASFVSAEKILSTTSINYSIHQFPFYQITFRFIT